MARCVEASAAVGEAAPVGVPWGAHQRFLEGFLGCPGDNSYPKGCRKDESCHMTSGSEKG